MPSQSGQRTKELSVNVSKVFLNQQQVPSHLALVCALNVTTVFLLNSRSVPMCVWCVHRHVQCAHVADTVCSYTHD